MFTYDDTLFIALYSLLNHLPFLEELDLTDVELSMFTINCLTREVILSHLKTLKITLPLVPHCYDPGDVLQLRRFGIVKLKQIFCSFHDDLQRVRNIFPTFGVTFGELFYATNSRGGDLQRVRNISPTFGANVLRHVVLPSPTGYNRNNAL